MLTTSWLQQQGAGIIQASQQVWVAYSGGVDSHVLLQLARQVFPKLRAIHINDHLSSNSDSWQRHCQQICAQLNILLECVSVKLAKGASVENAARIARRHAWQNMLGANDVLLLAHHADDQAETILYRLMRGTGPQGLVGMRSVSTLGAARIWRPFLQTSKQQILGYAQEHKLVYVNDESNLDTTFDRNYLRQNVMPLLLMRWPQAVKNIAQAAQLTDQLVQTAQPEIQKELAKIKSGTELDLKLWQQLPLLLQVETLRAWLNEHAIKLSYKQIQTIMREVIRARIDAQPEYKVAHKTIRRAQQKLFVLPQTQQGNESFAVEWDLNTDLKLPTGQILQAHNFAPVDFLNKISKQPLIVKLGSHGRKAKKIFQKYSIPPWQRYKYPLIFAEQRLVCVVGLWFSSKL